MIGLATALFLVLPGLYGLSGYKHRGSGLLRAYALSFIEYPETPWIFDKAKGGW